jgi:hypothetical protein
MRQGPEDLWRSTALAYFAHAFTFQGVVAECRFEGDQLSQIELHPIEILEQITEQTAQFGLPALKLSRSKTTATIRP